MSTGTGQSGSTGLNSGTGTSSGQSTPAPGSTGSATGPSATTNAGSGTQGSGGASTTLFDVPNTTAPGGIPLTPIPTSGPAASSQQSVFGGILIGFVKGGRNWVSDITLPAIKTQAIDEINNLKDNTENIIKNLGGDFPPTVHPCSGGGSKRFRKRLFNPLSVVEGLAKDALGLAGCIDDIVNDISNEIGPITGPPPPPDVISSISTQLDALEKAAEEEEDEDDDDQSSQSEDQSKTTSAQKTSDTTSQASSQTSGSKTSSSQTSSGTSSAASGCPSYVEPNDDITEWEGTPLPGSDGPAKRMFAMRSRPGGVSSGHSSVYDNPDGRNELVKREQGDPIDNVNGCTFPGGQQGLQPGYSALRGFVNLGRQPGGNGGQAGTVYNAASKWYVGQHDCSLPDGFKWFKTPTGGPNDIPTTPIRSLQSVDHVCKSGSSYIRPALIC